MDEKELVQRIRKSFKKKISRSEITKRLHKRGYRLEYIEKLIAKSRRPKQILFISIIVISIILFNIISIYIGLHTFDSSIQNSVLEETQKQIPTKISGEDKVIPNTLESSGEVSVVNTEFITRILEGLDISSKLHKHPLTQEPSIINFRIDNNNFYSEISNNIQTYSGSNENADIAIITTSKIILQSSSSKDPSELLKDSIVKKITSIKMLTSETELFAKGYLSFYNSLK